MLFITYPAQTSKKVGKRFIHFTNFLKNLSFTQLYENGNYSRQERAIG
jgi:hypothetical protein